MYIDPLKINEMDTYRKKLVLTYKRSDSYV